MPSSCSILFPFFTYHETKKSTNPSAKANTDITTLIGTSRGAEGTRSP